MLQDTAVIIVSTLPDGVQMSTMFTRIFTFRGSICSVEWRCMQKLRVRSAINLFENLFSSRIVSRFKATADWTKFWSNTIKDVFDCESSMFRKSYWGYCCLSKAHPDIFQTKINNFCHCCGWGSTFLWFKLNRISLELEKISSNVISARKGSDCCIY